MALDCRTAGEKNRYLRDETLPSNKSHITNDNARRISHLDQEMQAIDQTEVYLKKQENEVVRRKDRRRIMF